MTYTSDLNYSISEVLDILKHISEEQLEKIPLNIIKGLNNHKDDSYISTIDYSKPLKEANLSKKTLSLLAYIYREYLCSNEEKEAYNKILYDNQIAQVGTFDPNSIFGDKSFDSEQVQNTEISQNLPIAIHESFFRKVINKIKSFFKIN